MHQHYYFKEQFINLFVYEDLLVFLILSKKSQV